MKKTYTTFSCFSPPVMLLTMAFELASAIYIFVRQKEGTRKNLTIAILVGLGVFQLAEYMLCLGFGFEAPVWSKVGYVAITTLPALGLHLLHNLSGTKPAKLVQFAYTCMAALIISFLSVPNIFRAFKCTGNYVIFELNPQAVTFFSSYYYFFLLLGVIMGTYWARKEREKNNTNSTKKANQLMYVVAGYLTFMLPVIVVQSINPETIHGIPSIMCGFAVLFAGTLVYGFRKDKTLYK